MMYVFMQSADTASGRFIGPEALLQRAAALNANLGSTPRSAWRPIIDVLERHGTLVAIVRWREPQAVLVRRLAESSPGHIDPMLDQEPDGPRLEARQTFERALVGWQHPDATTRFLHPLDEPPSGSSTFLEDPASVPWTPNTYAPVAIGRAAGGMQLLDHNACVPLFRAWQALHLFELSLAGPRHFDGLDYEAWLQTGREGAEGAVRWFSLPMVDGFSRHRAALEATSWYEAYTRHALQLADSMPLRGGRFVVQGEALRNLRDEEARIADEALRRHGIGRTATESMIAWAGERALSHERLGQPAAREAYRHIVREAVEMLISLGASLEDIKDTVPDGRRILDALFPSWIATQRQSALTTFDGHILPTLQAGLDGFMTSPTTEDAEAFLDFVEAQGLLALYSSLQALGTFRDRPDPDADAGSKLHVTALSAWVEHVVNAVLDTSNGNGSRAPDAPKTLLPKIEQLWTGPGDGAAFRSAFGKMNPKKPEHNLPSGFDAVSFRSRASWLAAQGAGSGQAFAAGDAHRTIDLRNQALHRAVSFLSRDELVDAAILLIRTGFLGWLFDRRKFP